MSPPNTGSVSRRRALAAVATGLAGSLAGCALNPSFPAADVIAGPETDVVFEPAEVTVTTGDVVTWGFASAGHNVSCRPSDSTMVELPEAAASFASYGPEDSPIGTTVPRGETYEYTFKESGKYVYVCIPHLDRGMVGTVRVK